MISYRTRNWKRGTKDAAYIFLCLNSIVFKIIPAAFEKNYSLLVPKF